VRGLPVATPEYLTYGEGSYANPNPGPLPDDWPQRALMGAQWLALIGGLGLVFMAGPKESRLPRGVKGWLLSGIGVIGSLLVTLIASGLYSLPTILPPDIIADAVRTGLHEVKESDFESPEQYALAKRGEYLYTTTACMYCHGTDGRGGGKLSGQGVGTIWTRNISQSEQYGIGQWSDDEIARAIRSGISADGRPLYWQGMPWDHFGNLDEEDVRALVAYLKTMPPVDHPIHEYVPPSADDCAVYTFWVTPNNEPGCK
jgi:cytochrome c553